MVSGCTATSTTCTVSGSAGSYTISVLIGDQSQGSGGSYPSSSSALTVNTALAAGAVTPSAPSIDNGQTITLSSAASGGTVGGGYTYQWYSSATGTGACSAGTSIGGATAATYGASPASATYYCYTVTDHANTPVTQGSAWNEVTVNTVLVAGAVTPSAPTIDNGQTITLSSAASGGTVGGGYTYQWYSSATGTGACNAGTSIGGATAATYGASPGSATYYCYTVTDHANTPVTQGSAWNGVTVNTVLVAGAVTPSAPSIDNGQTITLSSAASGGTVGGGYAYQWYSSATGTGACNAGTSIGGATAATYGASPASATYYCYTVTDHANTPVTQGSAWNGVTVNTVLVAGAVTPSAPTIDNGQTITLSSAASGGTVGGGYTYQWYSSATGTGACSAGTSIGGATAATYGASPASATYYCYTVTDHANTPVTQGSAWNGVTVNTVLVAGAVTPSAPSIDNGQTITLSSAASGGTVGGGYTYQWYSSATGTGACSAGTSIGGATAATYGASPGERDVLLLHGDGPREHAGDAGVGVERGHGQCGAWPSPYR